jgi:hypothetical protein
MKLSECSIKPMLAAVVASSSTSNTRIMPSAIDGIGPSPVKPSQQLVAPVAQSGRRSSTVRESEVKKINTGSTARGAECRSLDRRAIHLSAARTCRRFGRNRAVCGHAGLHFPSKYSKHKKFRPASHRTGDFF